MKKLILILTALLLPVLIFSDENHDCSDIRFRDFVISQTTYEQAVEMIRAEPDNYTQASFYTGYYAYENNCDYYNYFPRSGFNDFNFVNIDTENKVKYIFCCAKISNWKYDTDLFFYENKLIKIDIKFVSEQVINALKSQLDNNENIEEVESGFYNEYCYVCINNNNYAITLNSSIRVISYFTRDSNENLREYIDQITSNHCNLLYEGEF